MEPLRLSDVFSIPGFVSLLRIPLAAAFPFALRIGPAAGLAVLIAAGATDVLDGWIARRAGRATATGALLDPTMDKVFVLTVAVTLFLGRRLPFASFLLLGARDLLELPLVVWLALAPQALADRKGSVRANVFGKAATVSQFATIAVATLGSPAVRALSIAAGASGLVAAATYWVRALDRNRPGPGLSGPGVRRTVE
jgi:phosphatidylglycerophosphate synthase